MQTKKRAHHVHPDVVEDRLAALRRRVPAKAKKTVLQGHVDELISLNFGSDAADGLLSGGKLYEFAAVAQGIVGKLRAECMRVHGRDVFDVPEIKTQIEGTIEGFYTAQLEKNMEVCFEALEKYVSDEPLLRYCLGYGSGIRGGKIVERTISVCGFEQLWAASGSKIVDGERIMPVECTIYSPFSLPDFGPDGLMYDVNIVPASGGKRAAYFAGDASDAEMSSRPDKTSLDLVSFINTSLRWPRVHRAESFGDALHSALETHIRRALCAISEGVELQEVLDRIGWAANAF